MAVAMVALSNVAVAQGQSSPGPQDRQGADRPSRNQPQGKKAGDWLRKYQNLPPQDQERLLGSDPQFQKLPPDRQSNLREHLRNFNSLPPEKKQRMLDRMAKFENLPSEQREQLKRLHERMHQIPENRRELVKTESRNLKDMTPQDRERAMSSERFRSMFSDDERALIKGLAEVPAVEYPPHPHPPGKQEPR